MFVIETDEQERPEDSVVIKSNSEEEGSWQGGCKKLLADVSYVACAAVGLEGGERRYTEAGGALNSPRVRPPAG